MLCTVFLEKHRKQLDFMGITYLLVIVFMKVDCWADRTFNKWLSLEIRLKFIPFGACLIYLDHNHERWIDIIDY